MDSNRYKLPIILAKTWKFVNTRFILFAPRHCYQVIEAILDQAGAPDVKCLWNQIKKEGAPAVAELAYREVYTMNSVEARKLLIKTYHETKSIRKTARMWKTSRHVVRKWVRRFQQEGEEGLKDRSRRPHHSPRQTSPEIEERVREARKATGYSRERLALYLQKKGLHISPHTIRHILRRRDPIERQRKRRKPLYPALWAWEVKEPFSLIQTDVKDVLDKQALGPALWDHLRKHRLPRYQWTACESLTRLRFLAYSHHLNRTNGLAFLVLILLWLRAHDITNPVTFQTDWGQEFGGDNPHQIAALETRFLQPLGGQLKRYPPGRKGYNGRVERSHRADDEEFYRPYLLFMQNEKDVLTFATRWVYFYNVQRPHLGKGMDKQTPLQVLHRLGYNGPDHIALFPPLLLDEISTDLILACNPRGGNDVLTYYNIRARNLTNLFFGYN
jgi:transposase